MNLAPPAVAIRPPDTPASATVLESATAPCSTGVASNSLATNTDALREDVILLVDDEPAILSALRRLLRPHGLRILTAESGQAGLALARENPVDLVISDMRMPGMNGAEFLKAMRAEKPEAPRILLTGYADIASTIAAINNGEIHRYIAKPWDDHDIVLTIREALARSSLERQNRLLSALTARQNEELRTLNAELEGRVAHRTAEIGQINAMLEIAYAELKTNFTLSMQIFSGLMEVRHRGMAGQSRRVAEYARRVCTTLGLDDRMIHDIHLAGLLHDIGKMGFSDAMLGKPMSLLSPDENSRFRRHTLNAEVALMPLADLHRVAKAVRSQHERIDGKGYPDCLEGDEIPLGARILAPIVDYENLMSGVLATRAFTADEAAASIRRGAGSRYEQPIVEAFLAVLATPATAQHADREIAASELRSGMTLSRDLISARGNLLLAAGVTFNDRIVHQIHEYGRRENVRITLHVTRVPARECAVGVPPAASQSSSEPPCIASC